MYQIPFHQKSLILLLLVMMALPASAQYTADWSSLDKRTNPTWWGDAKFGIFIHWGVYSVPAFSKVGQYSEWYWKRLQEGKEEYVNFHHQNYGKSFTYADFVPEFRAELFDPEQWADVFERSGAKYIVLTSKHHDGYTLWPSEQANQSWGRPWNSVETGPQRDLLGDLTEAVRQTDVKMGIYYSLYEWFNPLYTADVDLYVKEHMIPQFKDVVTKYQPAAIFSDGEWDHPDTTWHSEELLAWLYNDSPVKDIVVVDDRWGNETRHKHGGYYTTEYGSGLPNADHPWEESRGMAHSYGYSRTENLEDYNSAQALIYMLIDIVSRGGNFLLDIGPTADGRIPVIMQERLLQMGEWLSVNGEAIYGTRPWERAVQWSEGTIKDAERGEYMVEYNIMKLTVSPDEGMAVKEIMFTQKGKNVYAISPRYPKDSLVIQDMSVPDNAQVTLLGYDEPLRWEKQGKNLVVYPPALTPEEMPTRYAYVFKIAQ